jgi:hypothetical protein
MGNSSARRPMKAHDAKYDDLRAFRTIGSGRCDRMRRSAPVSFIVGRPTSWSVTVLSRCNGLRLAP